MLVALMLLYFCATVADGASLQMRRELVRYAWFYSCGFFAVLPPHLLYPEPKLGLLQLLNPGPLQLLRRQMMKLLPVLVLLAMAFATLALYDTSRPMISLPGKLLLFADSLAFTCGLALYAFGTYSRIGSVSQQWREGTRGRAYRKIQQETGAPPFLMVPVSMAPTMFATGRIAAVGMGAVIIAVIAGGRADMQLDMLAGLMLLALAASRLPSTARSYDRHYYQTNGFYDEALRSPGGGGTTTVPEKLPYESTYWIPGRWRPHAWAMMTQLNRRMPLGRVIIPAVIVLLFLWLRESPLELLYGYMLILVAVKNLSLRTSVTPELAPVEFNRQIQSPANWMLTRLFINLKWSVPIITAFVVVAALSDRFSYTDLLLWSALDLGLGLAAAAAFTWAHEGRTVGR